MTADTTQTPNITPAETVHARPHESGLTYCGQTAGKVTSTEVLPYPSHLANFRKFYHPCTTCDAGASAAEQAKTAEEAALRRR